MWELFGMTKIHFLGMCHHDIKHKETFFSAEKRVPTLVEFMFINIRKISKFDCKTG